MAARGGLRKEGGGAEGTGLRNQGPGAPCHNYRHLHLSCLCSPTEVLFSFNMTPVGTTLSHLEIYRFLCDLYLQFWGKDYLGLFLLFLVRTTDIRQVGLEESLEKSARNETRRCTHGTRSNRERAATGHLVDDDGQAKACYDTRRPGQAPE